jgi:hypothetical protein
MPVLRGKVGPICAEWKANTSMIRMTFACLLLSP